MEGWSQSFITSVLFMLLTHVQDRFVTAGPWQTAVSGKRARAASLCPPTPLSSSFSLRPGVFSTPLFDPFVISEPPSLRPLHFPLCHFITFFLSLSPSAALPRCLPSSRHLGGCRAQKQVTREACSDIERPNCHECACVCVSHTVIVSGTTGATHNLCSPLPEPF